MIKICSRAKQAKLNLAVQVKAIVYIKNIKIIGPDWVNKQMNKQNLCIFTFQIINHIFLLHNYVNVNEYFNISVLSTT